MSSVPVVNNAGTDVTLDRDRVDTVNGLTLIASTDRSVLVGLTHHDPDRFSDAVTVQTGQAPAWMVHSWAVNLDDGLPGQETEGPAGWSVWVGEDVEHTPGSFPVTVGGRAG